MRALTCFLVGLSLAFVESEPTRLQFNTHGFSIESLEESSELTVQAVIMSLPPTGGFAANVGVQVQSYAGSLDEYLVLSQQQLKQLGFEILRQETKDDQTLLEYVGTVQAQSLHFYSIMRKRDDKVILVTATAHQNQWPKLSKKLVRCAESFKLNDTK